MGIQNVDEYCEGDFICPRCNSGLELDEDINLMGGGNFEDYDCPNCGTRLCVDVKEVSTYEFKCVSYKEKYRKLYE